MQEHCHGNRELYIKSSTTKRSLYFSPCADVLFIIMDIIKVRIIIIVEIGKWFTNIEPINDKIDRWFLGKRNKIPGGILK
jgi:hypothetical protein